MDIAILGAGMGGLTTALRLHQRGFRPTVYEATTEIKPLGLGIAIQPYGTQEIDELGLLDDMNAISVEARDSVFYNQYGQEIYGEKCGKHMGYTHDQRFIHRGLMQMMLLKAVKERLGEKSVVLGARATSFEQDENGVTVRFAPGKAGAPSEIRADIVIAADGVKSAIRKQLFPKISKPRYSGVTLFRGVSLTQPFANGGTILHIGAPSIGSLIIYPILDKADAHGNTLMNWIVEDNSRPEEDEDWNHSVPVDEVAHRFDECSLPFYNVGEMLRKSHEVYLFPLVDHDILPRWSHGRVTLLGDAAHAMYPRGGNGACQAFVDAHVIADKIATISNPVEALKAYDDERRDYVYRIVIANRGDGPEVVRKIVEQRTKGQRFDDIETVLPFAEADAIFKQYHALAGMKRPGGAHEASGYRSRA